MATPRLTFLWPFLFKPAQSTIQKRAAHTARRKAHSSAVRRQEAYPQRYGTANEPPPAIQQLPSPTSKDPKSVESKSSKSNGKQKKEKVAKDKDASAQPKEEEKAQLGPPDLAAAAPAVMSIDPSSSSSSSSNDKPPSPSASQSKPSLSTLPNPPSTPAPGPLRQPPTNPLETVLNLPASDELHTAQVPVSYYHENSSGDPSEHRPPHITTPRYVHHFDTYSLVRRLTDGGWTPSQSITAMKAVRLILADNIDLARSGLVSKSQVENEGYLFRAACSELRTEVEMRRKAETEKSRTERTGLQHEVDILGQRVGMETQGLREELKGMVEGRKMAVREEGRGVDSKIQELNYRITVALNSDSRSDVEGVRWLITKRAIAALAICAMMVLGSLRYASSVMQAEEEARKRERERLRREERRDRDRERDGQGRHEETGEGLREMVVAQGDNPSFVSLG
ncbi:Hypothetical protein D9617_5g069050 [Elsinoe fawcettii]|nr:Hypothetical protein D9617_5g069050 [Elsinoe fawcettii]